MTISLAPATLRDIDEWALKANRTRSAFVRDVMRRYIRLRVEDEEALAEDEEALADPTHGGRFNPDLIGGEPWECVACAEATKDDKLGLSNQHVVSGWIVCPGCKTPRPEA
jgi:predicted transcriptional regulator